MYLTYGKIRKQRVKYKPPQLTYIFKIPLSLSKEECTVI